MYSFVIILNSAVISFFESKNTNRSCHCEECNDEAIQNTSLFEDWIASPSLARNDEKKRDYLLSKKLIMNRISKMITFS